MHASLKLLCRGGFALALVEAGSDSGSLNKLRVVDGLRADYLIIPELRNGMWGCDRFRCVGVHGDVPNDDSCFGRYQSGYNRSRFR